MKRHWLICYGGSNEDGVEAYYFTGTDDEAKRLVAECIRDLIKEEDLEEASFATKRTKEVQRHYHSGKPDGFYGYVCFDTYHVDVEAIPVESIKTIRRDWQNE